MKRRSFPDRFWSKVDTAPGHGPKGECWLWIGSLLNTGYGQISNGKDRTLLAHQVAYELTRGPIPKGKYVCHTCDFRACIRPEHFFLGTSAENMQDAAAKGRMARGSRNGNSKLTEEIVAEIRRLYVTGNFSQRTIAKRFGVTRPLIGYIIRRDIWGHVA